VTIPKVLLVNDDPASLFALESLLMPAAGQQQYALVTATSGQDALREVLKHDFAVILMDVSMPGMDGFETAEAIQSHPRSNAVPIIFITAHYADEINRLKAYQKGAVDYLFTPVIPQVLQTKVAVFVDMTRKNLLLEKKTGELTALNQDLRVQRLQDLQRINRALETEVAERRQAEERAHALSTRDALTGLLNRRSLIQQLEHAVASADRSGAECALLFLDLDQFKQVNDHYGHDTGDELLRHVAARLSAAVRVADVVARLGGDEFVVLIDGEGAAANAARVARKIEQAHKRPFDIAGHRIRTSTSIGIALYPQDGGSAQALLKNADLAMYHAKQHLGAAGHSRIQFFTEELNVREREREQWSRELRVALMGGQMELLYQPQVDVASGAVRGYEAQLHWHHPRLGRIGTGQFLPGLQDRALLDRLDAWTFATACAQAAAWRDAALTCAVSFKLCTPQLHTGVPARLLAEVRKHGLAPGSVTLELGEHLLFGPPDNTEALLRQLQSAGIAIALDDFGNGRFSLAACRKLGLDQLKMERALVRALGNGDGGTDIVAAVIHLARALKMRVVAMGVASAAQLAILQTLGCDLYQGELCSGPLRSDAIPTTDTTAPTPSEDFADE
jgi:diguanylate cyclase (GGDEF)-like protein